MLGEFLEFLDSSFELSWESTHIEGTCSVGLPKEFFLNLALGEAGYLDSLRFQDLEISCEPRFGFGVVEDVLVNIEFLLLTFLGHPNIDDRFPLFFHE